MAPSPKAEATRLMELCPTPPPQTRPVDGLEGQRVAVQGPSLWKRFVLNEVEARFDDPLFVAHRVLRKPLNARHGSDEEKRAP